MLSAPTYSHLFPFRRTGDEIVVIKEIKVIWVQEIVLALSFNILGEEKLEQMRLHIKQNKYDDLKV